MDVFINQFGHINKSVLPLRFGIRITQTHQSFASLDNEIFDPAGTERQRGDEKDRGNKHFLGTLLISKEHRTDGQYECKGRFVIAPPPPDKDLNRVVTALLDDVTNLKNDIATTKHLEGMLKRNRISTQEIIDFLHPAYLEGNIRDSNDIEEIYEKVVLPTRKRVDLPQSPSERGIIESGPEIAAAVDDIDIEEGEDESITPLVFRKLNLKPNIKYSYVMADAYVLDAGRGDGFIWLKVINSKGLEQELKSFSVRGHLSHHHDRALEYFNSRKGERAFMAICISGKYKGVLAESVTSIALNLMR